jgi:hypothetical protein
MDALTKVIMRTEIALIVGALFIGWGIYERAQSRFWPEISQKNFDANLFIAMGAINLSAALYSLLA